MAASSSSGGESEEPPAHSAPCRWAKALPVFVAVAGKGEDPAFLMQRNLADFVGRSPEPVEADTFGVAGRLAN